jgi:hypothetical protein
LVESGNAVSAFFFLVFLKDLASFVRWRGWWDWEMAWPGCYLMRVEAVLFWSAAGRSV